MAIPPQFLKNVKKAAPAAPTTKAPTKAGPLPTKGGDTVTKGDVNLLTNILKSEKIPARKAAEIVQKFTKGNT